MKDRIRQVMESQHMTQQVFAQYIELSPAALSSVFNGRSQPTLNFVEKIKKKIPNISTDWLMFGVGPMYSPAPDASADASADVGMGPQSPMAGQSSDSLTQEAVLDFNVPVSKSAPGAPFSNGVKPTRQDVVREEIKIIDKPQRRVTEIRVFYDDQTWESFVPAKK